MVKNGGHSIENFACRLCICHNYIGQFTSNLYIYAYSGHMLTCIIYIHMSTGNPVEGDICAFKDSTGAYYRAQVLKFSQPLGLYFYHREQARVSTCMCFFWLFIVYESATCIVYLNWCNYYAWDWISSIRDFSFFFEEPTHMKQKEDCPETPKSVHA